MFLNLSKPKQPKQQPKPKQANHVLLRPEAQADPR